MLEFRPSLARLASTAAIAALAFALVSCGPKPAGGGAPKGGEAPVAEGPRADDSRAAPEVPEGPLPDNAMLRALKAGFPADYDRLAAQVKAKADGGATADAQEVVIINFVQKFVKDHARDMGKAPDAELVAVITSYNAALQAQQAERFSCDLLVSDEPVEDAPPPAARSAIYAMAAALLNAAKAGKDNATTHAEPNQRDIVNLQNALSDGGMEESDIEAFLSADNLTGNRRCAHDAKLFAALATLPRSSLVRIAAAIVGDTDEGSGGRGNGGDDTSDLMDKRY